MERILLLYNPMSGKTNFKYELDFIIGKLQNKNIEIKIFRSSRKYEMAKYISAHGATKCDAIYVAGGDGSVNEVMQSMVKNKIHVPLGIIPAGTSNDFAKNLKIPVDFSECMDVLAKKRIRKIDVGSVNDQLFINVCCGGIFTDVSQKVDIEFKNTLGMLAYYLKGAEQIPKLRPMNLKIITDRTFIEGEFYLFFILNGSGAGGFDKLSGNAKIDDGYLDFIAIRNMSLIDVPSLFIKILRGEHLKDKNVLFLREKKMRIEKLDQNHEYETDIDGEKGPSFPLEVSILPQVLEVITG